MQCKRIQISINVTKHGRVRFFVFHINIWWRLIAWNNVSITVQGCRKFNIELTNNYGTDIVSRPLVSCLLGVDIYLHRTAFRSPADHILAIGSRTSSPISWVSVRSSTGLYGKWLIFISLMDFLPYALGSH